MNDDRWVSIAEYDDPEDARWTAARLAEEDIPARVVDPLEADPPADGPLVVLVAPAHVPRARATLAQDTPPDDGPDEPDQPDPAPVSETDSEYALGTMNDRQRLALRGFAVAGF